MTRNSFIFYRSFYDAIIKLPPDVQVEIYSAITLYALDGTTPDSLTPIAEAVFSLIKPQIDANNRRYDNGKKGGAPPGNKNARKKSKTTEKQPKNNRKTTEKQPNDNDDNILLSNSDELSNNNYHSNIVDNEIKNFIINKDGDVDVGDVAKKFLENISSEKFISTATEALSITPEEYLRHAQVIIAEWTLSGITDFLPENSPVAHLLNQIRIKRDSPAEKTAQQKMRLLRRHAQQEKQERTACTHSEEDNQPRGAAALQAYLRSKGLDEKSSLLDCIAASTPSEEDAIRDARTLIMQN